MKYREFMENELLMAADTANKYFGTVSGTVKPGDNNQVLTEADIAIGKQLVTAVEREFPAHNVIDEEAGGINKNSIYTWVIDPIEATSNFAVGLPQYGIMIGLLENNIPIAGGIIAPAYNKLYLAEKGKGATCNGEPISVTKEPKLSNALVSYGIDSYPDDPERTRNECSVLADLILNIRNMRNTGCEAVDTMYVAEGRFGARLNMTSKIWDNVASQAIIEEAGGLYTDINGSTMDYSEAFTNIEKNYTNCSSSHVLHEQILSIIESRLDN